MSTLATKEDLLDLRDEIFKKIDTIATPLKIQGSDVVPLTKAIAELETSRKVFKTFGIPIYCHEGHLRKQFCFREDIEAYKARFKA